MAFIRACAASAFAALAVCAGVALTPAPARAQLQNETLLVTMPKGFKVGYRAKRDNIAMTEMIPQGENLQNWTEMVTVHVFFGQRTLTPAEFRTRIEAGWKKSCPGGGARTLSDKTENGYPALTWKLTCAKNPQTGKPENTWFKAVAGGDSFYVVQKAVRRPEAEANEAEQLALIGQVSVCDTRGQQHRCPAGMK